MHKFTAGPWHFGGGVFFEDAIMSKKGKIAELLDPWDGIDKEEFDANGRLIAAAPQMLEALELIQELYDDSFLSDPADLINQIMPYVKSGIAAARGNDDQ